MKYCPNPDCLYARRYKGPAEFLDHATACNDCGAPLVDPDALGTAETARALSAWKEARDGSAGSAHPYRGGSVTRRTAGSSARIDVATGVALIGLSVVLLIGSHWSALSMGEGHYVVPFGPFLYGIFRLRRGVMNRKENL